MRRQRLRTHRPATRHPVRGWFPVDEKRPHDVPERKGDFQSIAPVVRRAALVFPDFPGESVDLFRDEPFRAEFGLEFGIHVRRHVQRRPGFDAADRFDPPGDARNVEQLFEVIVGKVIDAERFARGRWLSILLCRLKAAAAFRHGQTGAEPTPSGNRSASITFPTMTSKAALHFAHRPAGQTGPRVEPGPPLHMPSYVGSRIQGRTLLGKARHEKGRRTHPGIWEHKGGTPNDWGDALKIAFPLWHVMGPLFVDWKPSSELDAVSPAGESAGVAAA